MSWPVKPCLCSPDPYEGLDVSWPTSKVDKVVERHEEEKREQKGHKDVVVEDWSPAVRRNEGTEVIVAGL